MNKSDNLSFGNGEKKSDVTGYQESGVTVVVSLPAPPGVYWHPRKIVRKKFPAEIKSKDVTKN